MSTTLVDDFVNLAEAPLLAGVRDLVERRQKPDILAMLQMGMEILARRYDRGECAAADLVMAAELFRQALSLAGINPVRPRAGRLGSIVLGTVYDGHDLGKNLAAVILGAGGLRVIDLGSSLGPMDFQKAVRHYRPRFVGLSCASTLGFPALKACTEAVRRVDAAGESRILLGGAACDETCAAWAGTDIYCRTPREALLYCRALRSRWRVF